jgi:hypothetical protein
MSTRITLSSSEYAHLIADMKSDRESARIVKLLLAIFPTSRVVAHERLPYDRDRSETLDQVSLFPLSEQHAKTNPMDAHTPNKLARKRKKR